MTQIIPAVGMVGRWTLKPPIDTYLLREVVYTCRAVRSISNYLSNNENPFKDIYTPLGLSEATYNQDLEAGVSIVSLQSDNGVWVQIPVSYIVGYPDNNGVLYQSVMVGVGLRTMPKDMDLRSYVEKLTADTFDMLGVYPQVKVMPIDDVLMLDVDDSDNLIDERKNNIKYTQTMSMRIRILEEQNTALVSLLNRLRGCVELSCLYNNDLTGDMEPMDLYQFKVNVPMTAKDLFLYNTEGEEEEILFEDEDVITPPDLSTFRPVVPMSYKYMLLSENVYTDSRVTVGNTR